MSLYTPPYARVTVLSQSTNFAGSETNVFASASYTTYSYDGISSSVTFNTTQGAFTASEGGYYHAIINSYNAGANDATFRFRIYKNNSTVLYGGETRYDFQNHPSGSEKTFQTVLSLSAGDGVHVARARTSGASSNTINPGTTFVLRKISGSFANASRITSMGAAQAGSFNPYMSGTLDTDFSTSSYGADVTLSTASKGVTLNSTGSYYYISNLGVQVVGDQTATINLNVPSFGFDLINQSFGVDSDTDPTEITQHSMVYLASMAGLEVVPSASTTTSFIGSFGSSFSLFKLDNNIVYSTRFGTDSNTISGSTVYNLLSTSSYTTNGYSDNNTPDIAYEGIQFNSGSGLITLLSGGVYHITYNGIIDNTNASTDIVSTLEFSIRKNSTNCTDGTALYTSTINATSNYDPIETTLTTLFSASANDTVSICVKQTDASPANTVVLKENTSWSIYRIDTFTADPPPPDPYPYNETAGSASYSSNYIINSYSKSNQFERAVEQVPFGIQIPGPLSLRMRTDPAIKK